MGSQSGMEVGRLYQDARARVVSLVRQIATEAAGVAVPACPGWSVHDVLAHLVGNVEDTLAGRLTGPPTDEQVAAQVARHRGEAMTELVERWCAEAPRFEEIIDAFDVCPAAIDIVSHEHDIRGALAWPGERDSEGVMACADQLVAWFSPPAPVVVEFADVEVRCGPEEGEPIKLATNRFEALRFRMGRRSRHQLAALAWSGDPAPVLDHLVVFGPAPRDVIE